MALPPGNRYNALEDTLLYLSHSAIGGETLQNKSEASSHVGCIPLGFVGNILLDIGGVIASRIALSKRIIGIVMAFGAGTLISAVSYELIFEAVRIAKLSGFPALGLFAGAFTFFLQRLVDWATRRRRPG